MAMRTEEPEKNKETQDTKQKYPFCLCVCMWVVLVTCGSPFVGVLVHCMQGFRVDSHDLIQLRHFFIAKLFVHTTLVNNTGLGYAKNKIPSCIQHAIYNSSRSQSLIGFVEYEQLKYMLVESGVLPFAKMT